MLLIKVGNNIASELLLKKSNIHFLFIYSQVQLKTSFVHMLAEVKV